MTRTVRDAALLLQVMAGPDPRDPTTIDAPVPDFTAACAGDLKGLRVAWSPDLGFAHCDPETRQIVHAAAKRLADAGCTVEEPAIDWGDPDPWHRIIYQVGVAVRAVDLQREHPDWIEPSMQQMIDAAASVTGLELQRAQNERAVFYNRVRAFFETYDLLLTPGMPCGAWPAAGGPVQGPVGGINGRPAPTIFDRVPFFYPFNLTGQPAAVCPAGFTREGLPVALQIVGRWHADTTVLRASACFEAIQPWTGRRPPVD
jgi:aspartyl-tRNA(Asn)/glutamyl-tRNA(Gln) amidotransferase subunit A